MRFIVKRDEFLKALLVVGRAVNSKSSAVPVLANLKFSLNDEGLFITGSNFELTIQTKIPYSVNDVEIIRNYEEGETLINAKIITDLARKMDADEISLEVIDSTIAFISGGRMKTKLHCIKADEYPDIDLEANGTLVELTKLEFDSIVSQTAFAASTKEQRPVLTALRIEIADGMLTATALDSARMAKKCIPVNPGVELAANVPAKMMIEINHLLENSDHIDISFSDKKALFTFDNIVVATRLIAGDYPNTKNIALRVVNYTLEVNAQELAKAIDRVNIFSIDRENVVDFFMSDDTVEISAKSAQVGSASESIDSFKFSGGSLQISFNSDFVLSAIRALGCEDVTFQFVGEMKPFAIKNAQDDSVIQIVTPVITY